MPAWLHLIRMIMSAEDFDVRSVKRQKEMESALEVLQHDIRDIKHQRFPISRTGRDSIRHSCETHVEHTADGKLWKDHVVNKEVGMRRLI